jgi:uncharacterized membrane protein YoaK (UPF0700 family)
MMTKLPSWVLAGGALLAFIAGIVNTVGFLGVAHESITHLTGTTTLLGIAIGEGDVPNMLHFAAMIGSFLAGAVANGLILKDATLRLGRRYGVVLVAEALLLAGSALALGAGNQAGVYLASAGVGLQNAMFSTYSGAVMRTTHVSGTLTDIGIFFGQWLGGVAINKRHMRLLLTLVIAFFLGATAGTWLFHAFAYGALYVPALATGAIGLVYGIYSHLRRGAVH